MLLESLKPQRTTTHLVDAHAAEPESCRNDGLRKRWNYHDTTVQMFCQLPNSSHLDPQRHDGTPTTLLNLRVVIPVVVRHLAPSCSSCPSRFPTESSCPSCSSWFPTEVFVSVVLVVVPHRSLRVRRARRGSLPGPSCSSYPSWFATRVFVSVVPVVVQSFSPWS
jgi:hypothetical protein